ncbi:MAG TPA: SDR family oxidoreductase [Acidimicrobiia bacterium]|nr:SDR family oxidoreductase [Acidimicrobiia bacterium]
MTATDVPHRFTGKVALLTGAASGIGRASALRLAREGAQVFGFDVDGDDLAATQQLVADAGGTMQIREGDVSQRATCFDTVDACVDAFGRIDVLGNIAGIARAEHFVDVTEAQYRTMMGVNLDGCFFMAQAAVPHLLERAGNIVNIASNAGLMGQAYTVAYCTSKGAVVQMTRALAMEFVKTPMRVNAIAPGGTSTNLTAGFHIPADVDFELMAPYTGFRGMGTAEDVAALLAFVASDDAASIHGAILSVDRGLTAG